MALLLSRQVWLVHWGRV